ncbi:hypothetical protein, variant [Sphaeroforma arctica JP610]|uniref:Uncharacterized protein n=1 Tax=Sphaeroforma arctica JP610 TaxID=667725 RepID=A0A0L0G4Z4_9EUKA|nr:hypothetical protein, variant [Sphaeroforma arctica JP610]KNC83994.1 hypothetical protein, variant [Sphaeroforma arctica JP610]|eukprot:XP_014157896.1 hypothetical protein, variant [Sphaeroforma arctica JP610]
MDRKLSQIEAVPNSTQEYAHASPIQTDAHTYTESLPNTHTERGVPVYANSTQIKKPVQGPEQHVLNLAEESKIVAQQDALKADSSIHRSCQYSASALNIRQRRRSQQSVTHKPTIMSLSMPFMLESSQVVQDEDFPEYESADRCLAIQIESGVSLDINSPGDSTCTTSSTPNVSLCQIEEDTNKPDIYAHTNTSSAHNERLVLGEKAHFLCNKWYPVTLIMSSVSTLPFLIPTFLWQWDEHTVPIVSLSTVSLLLSFFQYFAFLVGIYRYRDYSLIKARGLMFTIVMMASAAALMLMSYMSVLLYSGVLTGGITVHTENVADLPVHLKLPNAILMCIIRVIQTFFMAVLTGRLAVVYTLFVSKDRVKTFSRKKVRWLFWRPVVILVSISVLVLLPYLGFTIAWYYAGEQPWLEDAFHFSFLVAMWTMMVVRGSAFLFYAWKCREVDLVFSDYAQNYRAGVLDTLLMLIVCIVWTVDEVGANAVVILQISAQVCMCTRMYTRSL